jgi:predicted metal-dependent hydrolase
LGRQYLLKVITGQEESVKLKGKYFVVCTNKSTSAKSLLENWYNEQAKNKLHSIAVPLIEKFKKYKVAPTMVELRSMSKRWLAALLRVKLF